MQKITQIHKSKFGLLRDDGTTGGPHWPLLIFNLQTTTLYSHQRGKKRQQGDRKAAEKVPSILEGQKKLHQTSLS